MPKETCKYSRVNKTNYLQRKEEKEEKEEGKKTATKIWAVGLLVATMFSLFLYTLS